MQNNTLKSKEIASISLSKLIEKVGFNDNDYYEDGCVMGYRENISSNENLDMFYFPTRINAFAVILCLSGEISLVSDLNHYIIHGKTLFVLRPGSILQLESVKNAKFYTIACEERFIRKIGIDPKIIAGLFIKVSESPCLTVDDNQCKSIISSLTDIISENNNNADFYSRQIIEASTHICAYRIGRVIAGSILIDKSQSTLVTNKNDQYFHNFLNAVAMNYARHRDVSFYAEMLHLTNRYMTTIIREISGRSAKEWITDYVILEAKNLLKFSSMSVQEVAYYLNFPNQSFFGKYFKRCTGISPSDYRLSQ